MYLHTPAVEAGSWWRVDTASGSDTGTTVYAHDGTDAIPNYYVLTGSTVRNTTRDGTAQFWSATQTLYLKELTYQGAPNGTVVTSTGVTPAAPVGGAPVDIATISTAVAALPTTYVKLLVTDATSAVLTGTLAAGHLSPVDCTAGPGARTLPAASSVAIGTPTVAKKADTTTNTLTVQRAGSDLIFGTGAGATSKTLTLSGEAITFVSNGVDRWTVQTSDTPSGVLASTYLTQATATGTYAQRSPIGGGWIRKPEANAVRLFPLATTASVATITYGSTFGSPTIASSSLIAISDSRIRLRGGNTNSANAISSGGKSYYRAVATGASSIYQIEFDTDAPRIEIDMFGTNSWNLFVDGVYHSATGLASANVNGDRYWTKVEFSTQVGSSWTITDAGDVLTSATAHGLIATDAVYLGAITSTTGASAGTVYYVKTVPSATSLTLSTSPGGSTLALTTDGSTASVTKLNRQMRRIRVFGTDLKVAQLAIGPLDTLRPSSYPLGPVVGVMADSYGQKYGSWTQGGIGYGPVQRLWGCGEVALSPVGGTGYLNNNGGSGTTFRGRINDLIANATTPIPDVIITLGGLNDQGRQSKATLQAETTLYFAALRAAAPNALLVATGPWAPNQTNGATSNYTDVRDAVSAGLATVSGPWLFIDNLAGTWTNSAGVSRSSSYGAWQTGTGYVSAATSTGNGNVYVSSDASHPTEPLGIDYLSTCLAQSIAEGTQYI